MAKSVNLNVTQNIANANRQIAASDTTTALQLQVGGVAYTVGTNDGVLKALMISSTDTAIANIQIIINDGTNDRVIGCIPVTALAGTTGAVASFDGLSPTYIAGLQQDQNGKYILPLKGGYLIKVKATVTLTAGKTVDVFTVIEEF